MKKGIKMKINYSEIYDNKNGTEIEIKVKAECHSEQEMKDTLSFIALSSHQFYLAVAEKIKSKL